MRDDPATLNFSILISRFSSSAQWDRVLDTARAWLEKDPEAATAHLAAGQALVHLERYSEAEPHLAKVLAADPENDLAFRCLSIVHYHQKRFKAADEAIHQAISLSPHNAIHWYHLAWMRHAQGDLASAKKYAERAQELAPMNSDITNLIAMCVPHGRFEKNARPPQLYELALEQDPENAPAHNNMGAYCLNYRKEYAAAEEHFRRALFFDPNLKEARSNLFLVLKQRDPVYRAICAPRDLLFYVAAYVWATGWKKALLFLAGWLIFLFFGRFVVGGLILWLVFFWPVLKAYEYLTLGDIRKRAGEIGAARGGFLGYRRWPLLFRWAIFVVLLASFWGMLIYFCVRSDFFRLSVDHISVFSLLTAAGIFLLAILGFGIMLKWVYDRFRFWRKARQLPPLLKSEPERRD